MSARREIGGRRRGCDFATTEHFGQLLKEWFDAKGFKLFGGDASQTLSDVIGSDSEDDGEDGGAAQEADDDGDELEHASGGSVKVSCPVVPDLPVEGDGKLAEPETDPLFFVKLSEARGTVFTCLYTRCWQCLVVLIEKIYI